MSRAISLLDFGELRELRRTLARSCLETITAATRRRNRQKCPQLAVDCPHVTSNAVADGRSRSGRKASLPARCVTAPRRLTRNRAVVLFGSAIGCRRLGVGIESCERDVANGGLACLLADARSVCGTRGFAVAESARHVPIRLGTRRVATGSCGRQVSRGIRSGRCRSPIERFATTRR